MKEEFRKMLKDVVGDQFQELLTNQQKILANQAKMARKIEQLERELQKQKQPVVSSSPFEVETFGTFGGTTSFFSTEELQRMDPEDLTGGLM